MKSVFAVTERPNGKVLGVHASIESATIQCDGCNRLLDGEYGIVQWILRDDVALQAELGREIYV